MRRNSIHYLQNLLIVVGFAFFRADSYLLPNFVKSRSVRVFESSEPIKREKFILNLSILILPQIALAKKFQPTSQEVESVLKNIAWDDQQSFRRSDFDRLDESDDSDFYNKPKFVEHIDQSAVAALKRFNANLVDEMTKNSRPPGILDLCSSHVSHLPELYTGSPEGPRVAGLGMNMEELTMNKQLTEYAVRDLNKNPQLPYFDDSFDLVICSLSIDYLTSPLQILKEVGRVLRSGGKAAVVFSDRLFLTKAVSIWTGKGDLDHIITVGEYFHYCDGGFDLPVSIDLMKGEKKKGDPLYAVVAEKIRGQRKLDLN